MNPAHAGLVDEFAITLEQTVSNGVPGPGAGNLEAAGAIDRYTFFAAAGTRVYLDELSASNCSLLWRLFAPDASTLFTGNNLCVTDPGIMDLPQTGTYTIEAYSPTSTGTYSFVVWAVNPVENFAITLEQTVSNGVPSAGAGNIEEPGAIDRYTFSGVAGTEVYFDELFASNCSLVWTCRAPDQSTLFASSAICVTDPGVITLPQTGTYTIDASGNGGSVGTYSFTIWEINPTDEFTISLKQTVSNGVPGPGAGNLEEAGTMDRYTLSGIAAGTVVYFDELFASNCTLRWRCIAPDDSIVFDDNVICVTDPGEFVLDQAGDYTIETWAPNGATGTYSFIINEVNNVQTFPITLEQTVSNGVPAPGAGNLEEAGAVDEYTFSVTPGTLVFFDELFASNCTMQWRCTAPDDSVIFANNPLCVTDPALFTLTQAGTYRLRVSSSGGVTGTYSFIIWQVNPPQDFNIVLDSLVTNGVPGPGAGNIEEPGSIDRYTLTLAAPTSVCFEELGGPCSIQWQCTGPAASVVFANQTICVTNPGKFLLPAGTFTITASGVSDGVGAYSIIANTGKPADVTRDCHINVNDLLLVINGWGACPDPNDCPADVDGDDQVDVDDLLAVINGWD